MIRKATILFWTYMASNQKVLSYLQYSQVMFYVLKRTYSGRNPERWENRRRPNSP